MTQKIKTQFQMGGLMLMGWLLAACQAGPQIGTPETGGDIAVLRLAEGKTPPQAPGACWQSDIAPAVIETVTEHVQTRPERRDAAGNTAQSAEFQTRTAQRMVSDRSPIWFRAPCPEQMTLAFVASLQRALKARGWYFAPITGEWDDTTLAALRKYQRSRGLDSHHIALTTAQDLGLIAADL